MTVYVDDANIPAEVRNGTRVHRSAWSHLTADTKRSCTSLPPGSACGGSGSSPADRSAGSLRRSGTTT
jgi:hypothetical protein